MKPLPTISACVAAIVLAMSLSLQAAPAALPELTRPAALGGSALSAASTSVVFTITGRGHGHGVGMTQWGARAYALQGKSYQWILRHYYSGTTLKKIANSTVKVNLSNNAVYGSGGNSGFTNTAWTIRPYHTSGYVNVGGTNLALGKAYKFVPSGSMVKIIDVETQAAVMTTASPVSVVEKGPSPSLLRVAENTGNYDSWRNRAYRGSLKVYSNGSATKPRLKLVEWLPMDQYLYGVVPEESGASWPTASLRAQAICARSEMALTSRELYCYTMDQAYGGYLSEQPTTNAAVDATSGEVVWYKGTYGGKAHDELVRAYYFCSSGGYTSDIEDIWIGSDPKPYYRAVVDADASNPSADGGWVKAWSPVKYTAGGLGRKLRASAWTKKNTPSTGTLTKVVPVRASGSWVRTVRLYWTGGRVTSVTGERFRLALGLKSGKFWVRRS